MGSNTRTAGAIRSLVVPGWGQWTQARRRLGMVLLASVAAPLLGLAIFAAMRPTTAAGWLLRPEVLMAFLLLNLLLAGIRAWAIWDAWAGGVGHPRRIILLALVAIALFPHVGMGWLQVRTAQALGTVFAAPPPTTVPALTSTTTTTTPGPTTPPDNETTTITTEPPTTTTTPTTTSPPLPPWGDRLTIMLLGSDGDVGRSGVRTDAMMVLDIDTATGNVFIFSLPRNLRGYPFAEAPAFTGILNEVYGYGQSYPAPFEGVDPGAAAITSVAEQISGIEIDYFAMLDFYAFVNIVDALGGVTVYVPHDILYPEYHYEDDTYGSITIQPGMRELTGDEALAFVRSRKVGSDYGRMQRQRCLVSALITEADIPSITFGLPSLISSFEERVTTDIPLAILPEMLDLVAQAHFREASLVTFGPPLWHSGWIEGGWPVPDVERIQTAVSAVLAGDTSVLGSSELISAEESCRLP